MPKLTASFLLLSVLIVKVYATPGIPAAPVFPNGLSFTTNALMLGSSNNVYVITADVNGDGSPDIISANFGTTNQPGTLTVFINNGLGTLGSNATYTVAGTGLSSVAAADIYGNGHVDLIASMTNGTLVVLTNNGTGGFGSNATYTVGLGSACVAAADVNGDGYPDLISANENNGALSTLTVLTNNGTGGFGSNATYAVGYGVHFVAAADINGDGDVDLVAANSDGASLTVLTNNGSGGFATSETLNTSGGEALSVAIADVNGDGLPDLIAPLYQNNTLLIFTNAGNGRFALSATLGQQGPPLFYYPYFVDAVTNVDGHGTMALAIANSGNGSVSPISSTLTVLTNNGTGTFGSNAIVHVGGAPECVAAADFFGNGMMDLVSANAGTNTLTVLSNTTVFYNPSFTVGSAVNYGVSVSGYPTPVFSFTNVLPRGVFYYDNSNGTAGFGGTPPIGSGGVYTLSLVASNYNYPYLATQQVTLTINQRPIFPGDAFATNYQPRVPYSFYSVAAVDINHDGLPDLVAAGENSTTQNGVLSVYTNNGTGFGSNASYTVSSSGNYPRCVLAVTNLDGRKLMGLVSANYGQGDGTTLTVLTNNGTGVFGSNATYTVGRGPVCVIAADIYGNGKPALISANYSSSTLTVLTNNGFGVFGSNTAYNVGSEPEWVTAADLNRNGKMDLVCASENVSSLTVLTNNGSGVFATSSTLNANGGASSVVAADIYGNGKLALITADSSSSTLTVFTNKGNGVFGANATLTFAASSDPQCVTAADINGDGYVDLISANYNTGTLIVLTNNGAGVFGSNITLNVGSNPQCVTAVDVNGDGYMDLISANVNNGGSPITVFTNEPIARLLFLQGNAATASIAASGYPTPVLNTSNTPPDGVAFNAGIYSGIPAVVGMTEITNVFLTATNAFGTAVQNNFVVCYQAPLVAGTAAYNVTENGTLSDSLSHLMTNDVDPNFQVFGTFHDNFFPSIAAMSATSTNGGTVDLFLPSTFTYYPVHNFTGQDQFTYTYQDDIGLTAQGTVLATVYPPPVAGTNIVSTAQNTPLVISTTNLVANNTDPGGFPMSITSVSASSTNGGTVGLSGGIITYTPVTNYTGQDQFTYTFKDSLAGTGQATVLVIVTAPGSPAYNTVQMTPPSADGSQVGLSFTGLPGQTYYIQTTTNIFSPFVDVPPPIVADANGLVSNTITVPVSSPGQYYRISLVP